MVLLRGLDFVESRPEVALAELVVGGREVVVVVAFSGACYAGVVAADRMMATRVAVPPPPPPHPLPPPTPPPPFSFAAAAIDANNVAKVLVSVWIWAVIA